MTGYPVATTSTRPKFIDIFYACRSEVTSLLFRLHIFGEFTRRYERQKYGRKPRTGIIFSVILPI